MFTVEKYLFEAFLGDFNKITIHCGLFKGLKMFKIESPEKKDLFMALLKVTTFLKHQDIDIIYISQISLQRPQHIYYFNDCYKFVILNANEKLIDEQTLL